MKIAYFNFKLLLLVVIIGGTIFYVNSVAAQTSSSSLNNITTSTSSNLETEPSSKSEKNNDIDKSTETSTSTTKNNTLTNSTTSSTTDPNNNSGIADQSDNSTATSTTSSNTITSITSSTTASTTISNSESNEQKNTTTNTNLTTSSIPATEEGDNSITNATTPTPSSTLPTVKLNVRYQDKFIWQGQVKLSSSTLITYHPSTTSTLVSTTINKLTVLTALIAADQQTNNFSISDLVYYSDWGGSYYLKCLQLATSSICDNWTYAVNNQYASVGMDNYNLSGGETIYIYYGTPWKITASSSTLPVNTTTTLQTWRYNYDDLTSEWTTAPNNLIDISINKPTSTSYYDTTITVATTTSDNNGKAEYSFNSTGTYYAKITSADWSKWSNPITLTILETASSSSNNGQITGDTTGGMDEASSNSNATETENTPSPISETKIQQTVEKIINYVHDQQDSDGKIIDAGTTDWLIMSMVAAGYDPAKIKTNNKSLLDYALNYMPNKTNELNECTGYSRHLLSLYAAGIAKTDNSIQNLLTKITDNCYNQNNFGKNGINDDIFGLISLLVMDTNINEPIIQNLVADIIADQQTNGSFTWAGWPGKDITGGAINALEYAASKGINIKQSIIDKAKAYLKTNQLTDGGWTNYDPTAEILTTAWVMMGINSLEETQADWFNTDKNPWYTLIDNLTDSGYYQSSYQPGTDWFATKHAIPALLGYSWPIEPKFKQTFTTNDGSDNNSQSLENSSGGRDDNNSITNNLIIATSTLNNLTENLISTTTPTSTIIIKQTSTTIINTISNPNPNTKQLTTKVITANTTITATSTNKQIISKPIEQNNKVLNPKIATKSTSSLLTISSATKTPKQNKLSQQIINQLPLNTPTRQAAKRALAVSGGGSVVLGLYLGFKLLKNLL